MKQVITIILLIITAFSATGAFAAEQDNKDSYDSFKQKIVAEFSGRAPKEWGETVSGVKTELATDDIVIALTLDACGSPKGKGFDAVLINYLEREKIPATLFINARWIDANRDLFLRLAANPLFEIANHGLHHKPASVNGKSVYGISGTKDVAELVDEIESNALKIQKLTGKKPKYLPIRYSLLRRSGGSSCKPPGKQGGRFQCARRRRGNLYQAAGETSPAQSRTGGNSYHAHEPPGRTDCRRHDCSAARTEETRIQICQTVGL